MLLMLFLTKIIIIIERRNEDEEDKQMSNGIIQRHPHIMMGLTVKDIATNERRKHSINKTQTMIK